MFDEDSRTSIRRYDRLAKHHGIQPSPRLGLMTTSSFTLPTRRNDEEASPITQTPCKAWVLTSHWMQFKHYDRAILYYEFPHDYCRSLCAV